MESQTSNSALYLCSEKHMPGAVARIAFLRSLQFTLT
jgi:hypothetical protein